jgi:predicted NAD/FAD-dependent oxidoreductase
MTQIQDVIIIGAGIAGLSAADVFKKAGCSVLLLDKGRGVGGRMATRRMDPARTDHGAQFFTVRDPRFEAAVQQWIETGAAKLWCHGFNSDDGHPRYCGTQGMNGIAKHLASAHNVRTSTRVVSIDLRDTIWHLRDQENQIYQARALLVTAPAPQAVELLRQSEIYLPTEADAALKHIRYDPCLAVLLKLEGPSGLQEPGALQINGEPVHWVADAHIKGISPHQSALTIHAGANFSKDYWTLDDESLKQRLIEALPFRIKSPVLEYQIMRWRYSQPSRLCPDPCIIAQEPGLIGFAGDAYMHARVEGAFLSGLAGANKLLEHL